MMNLEVQLTLRKMQTGEPWPSEQGVRHLSKETSQGRATLAGQYPFTNVEL